MTLHAMELMYVCKFLCRSFGIAISVICISSALKCVLHWSQKCIKRSLYLVPKNNTRWYFQINSFYGFRIIVIFVCFKAVKSVISVMLLLFYCCCCCSCQRCPHADNSNNIVIVIIIIIVVAVG
jgi:hypothetical protein